MKKIKALNMINSMGDGGAQQVLINYLQDLKSDPDIDFVLYVYGKKQNSKYDRIIEKEKLNVHYLNVETKKGLFFSKIYNFIKANIVWKKVIIKEKPNIVHIHISSLIVNTLYAIKCNKVPVRFDTLHSSPLRYKGKELFFIRRAFQKEKFIPICVTNEQAQVAQQYYGFKDYEVIYNGIDIEHIKKRMVSKEESRKKYNIQKSTFVVLGVGRLNKVKRFDILIKAFSIIEKKNPDSILLIAGEGKEKKCLENIVKELGLEKKVSFLGNQEDVIPLYCASDVMGITSSSESASLVLLESQVCGLRSVISFGTPKESIFTENIHRLSENASLDEWALALLNKKYKGEKNNNINEFEVHQNSKKLKEIYIKHHSNSQRGDVHIDK